MKCPECNGTGELNNDNGDIVECDICEGTGKVEDPEKPPRG